MGIRSKIENINRQELMDLLKNRQDDYQFIDVRTPGEYNSGKLKGFKNIPLQVLEYEAKQLIKSKPVVVICESGSRSVAAAKFLSGLQFTSILNVRGGISIFR